MLVALVCLGCVFHVTADGSWGVSRQSVKINRSGRFLITLSTLFFFETRNFSEFPDAAFKLLRERSGLFMPHLPRIAIQLLKVE